MSAERPEFHPTFETAPPQEALEGCRWPSNDENGGWANPGRRQIPPGSPRGRGLGRLTTQTAMNAFFLEFIDHLSEGDGFAMSRLREFKSSKRGQGGLEGLPGGLTEIRGREGGGSHMCSFKG